MTYHSTADPEEIQDFYLRLFAQPNWQLGSLTTHRIPNRTVFSGGMSGLSDDQDQALAVSILQNGTKYTIIQVEHFTDLKQWTESQAPPPHGYE